MVKFKTNSVARRDPSRWTNCGQKHDFYWRFSMMDPKTTAAAATPRIRRGPGSGTGPREAAAAGTRGIGFPFLRGICDDSMLLPALTMRRLSSMADGDTVNPDLWENYGVYFITAPLEY